MFDNTTRVPSPEKVAAKIGGNRICFPSHALSSNDEEESDEGDEENEERRELGSEDDAGEGR